MYPGFILVGFIIVVLLITGIPLAANVDLSFWLGILKWGGGAVVALTIIQWIASPFIREEATEWEQPAPQRRAGRSYTEDEILSGVDVRKINADQELNAWREKIAEKNRRESVLSDFFQDVEITRGPDIFGGQRLYYRKQGKPTIEHAVEGGQHVLRYVYRTKSKEVFRGSAEGAVDYVKGWKK